MPDIWMDVDTALSEVPVNVFPLTDDTDFKTREESVVYNQAGMDLLWNFVTTGGAYTQTAVTPTTGGDYDWANQGNGMYSIEIPASGGASINNDTEGFGWFSGYATGILPWRGPVIGFRAAALNNALIDGGDLLDVNVTYVADTAQTANDNGADINAILADTNELQTDLTNGGRLDLILDELTAQGDTNEGKIDTIDTNVDAILVDTGTTLETHLTDIKGAGWTDENLTTIDANVDAVLADTNELQTDDTPGALAAIDAKIDTIDTNVDAILVDTGTTLETHLTDIKGVGWTDENLTTIDANVDAVLADTNELQTDDTPGALAAIDAKIDTIDTNVDAVLVDTGTTLPATLTTMEGKIDTVDGVADAILVDTGTDLPATLATIAGYLDTEIAAILADTNELQGDWTNGGRLDLLIDAIKVVTDALTSAAATKLALSAGTIVAGTVSHDNTAATTTVFYSDDITEATADHYNGRIVIFTSGALQYQATDITDYALESGEGKFTVTALTEAPADNVTFIII